MPPKIEPLRKKIDAVDRQILDLLNQRARVVIAIGKIKKQFREEIYAPHREKILLDRLARRNRGPWPPHALRAVFGEILSASRALQSPMKVAFLGPEATFTHLATVRTFGHSTEMIPEGSISRVFDAVEHGRADRGVVPIENTTEGVVGATLDRFLDSSLKITGEMVLPVSHHLLSRNGSLHSIRKIYSHPQAAGQCRNWLEEHLPRVPVVDVESTAKAAELAAREPHVAGIAGEQAAELYGLKVVKRHVEDNPNNMTRFLIIGKKSPTRTGHDRTSLLFSVKDEVGILYRMLEPFFRKRINLTKIESRPLKKKAWEYIFYLDLDGHMEEKRLKEAVTTLEKDCRFVRLLGSYPKAT